MNHSKADHLRAIENESHGEVLFGPTVGANCSYGVELCNPQISLGSRMSDLKSIFSCFDGDPGAA